MIAFRAEMRRKGIKTSVFPEGDDFDDFQDRLREWVRKLPKPAAVMAVSDMRAADVINACKAEGILVPSQVAVVGVDNDISQHGKCRMSISSVVLNMNMMGRQAVRELDFLFRHQKWHGRPHEILIPAKDVLRAGVHRREPSSQNRSGRCRKTSRLLAPARGTPLLADLRKDNPQGD